MVFEHIEKLKQEYSDKYVVVDGERPELKRFAGQTGAVKTVNMNGRALVEFDGYNNIGWYDIDIDFLKVIDEPLAKQEAAKPASKQAPAAKKSPPQAKVEKAPSELEKARSEKEGKKPGAMSVSDILAAARGEKKEGGGQPAAPAAKSAPADSQKESVAAKLAAARIQAGGEAAPAKGAAADTKKMSTADILAAARSKSSPAAQAAAETPAQEASAPEKLDPKKMSTAEMLAAARAEKSGGGSTPAEAPPAAPEPAEAQPAAQQNEPQPADAAADVPTDTAGMLAYCRRVDGGG